MSDSRRPIPPNPPRWSPPTDASALEIPGIDPTASANDQIDQIEQLITVKLQNIDENFSKIHNLLATRLLPAVKRYAVGTEPVREAAKFWTSFYEQAAQIRIPSYEDYSSMNESSVEAEPEQETTMTQPPSSRREEYDYSTTSSQQSAEHSIASTDNSFMPTQAAFSSTPATAHRQRMVQQNTSFASQGSDDPSWSASLESPLVRIDRELQKLSMDEPSPLPMPSFTQPTIVQDQSQEASMISKVDKGKGKEVPGSLLRNVLKNTLDASAVPISPLKLRKPKTPIPKTYNPYLSPNVRPTEWSGLVDLSDPSSRTPQRFRRDVPSTRRSGTTTPDDDDDSFDGLPPGMSPPRLMSPARPPRSAVELGLGRTPIREAASRISRDIVGDVQRQSAFSTKQATSSYYRSEVESSMSTVPTPPSLSRYAAQDTDSSVGTGMDASIESMMRRAGLTSQPPPSHDHNYPSSDPYAYSQDVTQDDASVFDSPLQPDLGIDQVLQDEDSDSDSDDEVNNTAHPSAAFLMASRGRGGDDSFGSSNHSGDSFDDDIGGLDNGAPVHPFAGTVVDDGFDDSFDDDSFVGNGIGGVVNEETETVFGVPPVQRRTGPDGQEFRMLGEDLLQDTIGFTAQLGLPVGATDSPTPANWPGATRN